MRFDSWYTQPPASVQQIQISKLIRENKKLKKKLKRANALALIPIEPECTDPDEEYPRYQLCKMCGTKDCNCV